MLLDHDIIDALKQLDTLKYPLFQRGLFLFAVIGTVGDKLCLAIQYPDLTQLEDLEEGHMDADVYLMMFPSPEEIMDREDLMAL